jgi:hypothetical protein
MSNRTVLFGYYHPDFESIYLPTLVHRFTRDLSSSSDKVSSDTSVTDKQPLLTPNQGLSNVDDIIPDDFHAKEALRSLKSSFEEASSTTLALTAPDAETTVLGKHPLTPPEATANVTDTAAENFRSLNSAFTLFKVAPAVDQGPHSMSTLERPSKKARTSRLDKIAMFLQQNEMQVAKGLRPSFTTNYSAAAQASYY